nr:beta-1,3-N-acetylglucosaminyltransferase radical fringe-like [Lytechinus pictus]
MPWRTHSNKNQITSDDDDDMMPRYTCGKTLKIVFGASYALMVFLVIKHQFRAYPGVKPRSVYEDDLRSPSLGADRAPLSHGRSRDEMSGNHLGYDGVDNIRVNGGVRESTRMKIQTTNEEDAVWDKLLVGPAKSPSKSNSSSGKPGKGVYISPKLPDYRPTDISDLFIGVKTTGAYHSSRVQLILDTWHSFAPEQIYFFTDVKDPVYEEKTNGHMVNTDCPDTHKLTALACKTSSIFTMFEKIKDKRWLCHVDDDNYLNVPELLRFLNHFDHHQELFFGRESINYRTLAIDRDTNETYRFWFATGGGGVCFSKPLTYRMMKYTSKGKLAKTAEKIGRPDDITIGFIVEILLGKSLTRVRKFNSHIQKMSDIPTRDLIKQITLSYCLNDRRELGPNVIDFRPIMKDDPTRFKSFHCTYYRKFGGMCPYD